MSDADLVISRSSLRSYAPFSHPGVSLAQSRDRESPPIAPIQNFLDELPSIESFLSVDYEDSNGRDHEPDDRASSLATDSSQMECDADGWAMAGWQSFDWGAAASLGVGTEAEPQYDSGWGALDGGVAPGSRSASGARYRSLDSATPAEEVASALDGIARRIRSGELIIDQVSGTPPEAALAAALASLLRMRG